MLRAQHSRSKLVLFCVCSIELVLKMVPKPDLCGVMMVFLYGKDVLPH